MKFVVVVFVAAIVLDGGSMKADFIMDAVSVEDMPGSGKGESFSQDGLRLYIAPSHRPGGYGNRDIWVVDRESVDAPWGEAVNLGPNINTEYMEGWPTVSPNDLELYFGRDDGTNWYPMRSTRTSKDEPWGPATEYDGVYPDDFSSDGLEKYTYAEWDGGYGGNDIWVTTRETIDDEWGEPVNLGPNVNDSGNQFSPSISSDGSTLFFTQGSPNNLYMCVRSSTEEPWGPAVDIGPPVNGSWWVGFPEISPDGSTLYCNRLGGLGFTQVSFKPIVDFNGDGFVDILDLVILVNNWGTDNTLCAIGPMPWGDGIVYRADLEVLMEYYNQVIDAAAYYKLDEIEGAVSYDSSGYYLDAILIGDPNCQPEGGMIDGAIEFDGIDDFISTPFILNPANGPFSIFAWILGGNPGETIISQADGVDWLAADLALGCLMTDLKASGRSASTLCSQTCVTDGQWHRIGFVWDGSDRILYVDDVEAARDTQPSLQSCEAGLYIGAGSNLELGTFFSGMIDDVRIYNRVITP